MTTDRHSSIHHRAEASRHIFERELAAFVARWKPEEAYMVESFQRELLMLFRDAMEHKSMTYGLHIERTEAMLDTLSVHATAPLNAIFNPPKKET